MKKNLGFQKFVSTLEEVNKKSNSLILQVIIDEKPTKTPYGLSSKTPKVFFYFLKKKKRKRGRALKS